MGASPPGSSKEKLFAAAAHRPVIGDLSLEEALREDGVVGLDEPAGGAEVLLQVRRLRARRRHLAPRGQVGLHVGAAEAVDGLLGVADEVERVTVLPLEEDLAEDVPLHLVGVLELVDERDLVALAQQREQRRPALALERLLDQREHVLEVEAALGALEAGHALLDQGREAGGDQRAHLGDDLGELAQRGGEVGELGVLGGRLAEVLAGVVERRGLAAGPGLGEDALQLEVGPDLVLVGGVGLERPEDGLHRVGELLAHP
ncbi:MAG: hypothetical protein QM765_17180 [Myxococcales bacterium]